MPTRFLLVVVALGLFPQEAPAQATGRMSEVVSELAEADGSDLSRVLALRAELSALMAEDPSGPAARTFFEEARLVALDGSTYSNREMGTRLVLAVLEQEPLPALDRSLLLADAVGIPFGLRRSTSGSCLAALAFELEFREPRTDLERELVAARPALVRMALLSELAAARIRLAVLEGTAPGFGEPGFGKDPTGLELFAQVFGGLILRGPEDQSQFLQRYNFLSYTTGEPYSAEEVREAIARLTAQDWAMITAAQPYRERFRQMFEAGVSDPRELYCRP